MLLLMVLLFVAYAAIWMFVLMAAANEEPNEMSVPATRILNGNESFPRLRAVPPLSQDDAGVDRWPVTLSGKAAKGFNRERARDRVIGVDQVSAQERQRWTGGDVKPWGIN